MDPAMTSNNRLVNSNAMSPTTDADFAFAPPMQMQPYLLGFDAGMSMPTSVERPLLQQPNSLYDNFDFAAGFPFQEPSSLLLPTTSLPHLPPPQPSPPSMAMAMAMPPSLLQMPPLVTTTLPGVPTTAELYHPFGGAASFLKREDGPVVDAGGGGRIGLNLGRRTYFSPADVLAVDRLLTRSSLGGVGMGMGMGMGMAGVLGLGLGGAHHHQPPRCQAEGCKADLSAAKHYHRRHKVCEYHAKAAAVAAAGKQQRFCQQCSRFHVLAEFDEAKRSCRKRLTEHNRRRRKPASAQGKESSPPPKKADITSITTSSYNSDHKSASTAAAKSTTAISPNGSGVSCLDMDNGQTSRSAPTALSLAALPLPEKDGGLDTMLMQQQVHGRDDDDDDEQHFMTSLVQQAQQQHQQHHVTHNGGGNILSCSSVSDHQQNSGCNGFFEVDFI